MINMYRNPKGRALLRTINFKGVAPAKDEDEDYDEMRRLQLRMPK